MPDITQGTDEFLICSWSDTLNILTSLSGTGPKYDVKDTKATPFSYITAGDSSTTFLGLNQYCLVDTRTSPGGSPSGGGLWLPGIYDLWVYLTTPPGSERPRKGPFQFTVV